MQSASISRRLTLLHQRLSRHKLDGAAVQELGVKRDKSEQEVDLVAFISQQFSRLFSAHQAVRHADVAAALSKGTLLLMGL